MSQSRDDQNQVAEILKTLKSVELNPSPYMKTRVLAHVRERAHARKVRIWKWFGILSPIASMMIVAGFFYLTQPNFKAEINQPILVSVEVKQVNTLHAELAEISLPDGVFFYSKKYPELKEKRTLTVSAEAFANGSLPLVIKSENTGKKSIKVQFKDNNNQIIGEKVIQIKFNG